MMPGDDVNSGMLSYRSTPSAASPGSAGGLYNGRSPGTNTSGVGASMGGYGSAKSPQLAQLNQQLAMQQHQQQVQQMQQQNQQRRSLSNNNNNSFNAAPGSFGGQYFDGQPEEDFAIGSAGAYQLGLGLNQGQRNGGISELNALRDNSFELSGYGIDAQHMRQPHHQSRQQMQSTQQFGGYAHPSQQQPQQGMSNSNNSGYRSNRMF